MSDQENIKPDAKDEDVEAHGRKKSVNRGEEIQDEGKEDDVELHLRKKTM